MAVCAFTEPSTACLDHVQRVLRFTLLRPIFTRGRATGEAPKEQHLRALAARVLDVFNGDISKLRVTHFCKGCCPSARATALNMADVLVTCLEALSTHLPSTSKWWTFEPCMAPAVFLLMLHNIIGRATDEAFFHEAAAANDCDEDAEVDWHQRCSKRVRQARDLCHDSSARLHLALALWASEPMDLLDAVAQHGDAGTHCVWDLTHPAGPILDAQAAYFGMLAKADAPVPLTTCVQHFGPDPDISPERVHMIGEALALECAGALYLAYHLNVSDCP